MKRKCISDQEACKFSIYRRAKLMYLFLSGYVHFHNMRLAQKSVDMTLSYEQAEKACELINKFSDTNCRPTDLITNPDEESNKVIENYQKLQEELNGMDDFMKETAMSFYNQISHSFIGPYFEISGYLTYINVLAAFLTYVLGITTTEEINKHFIRVSPLSKKIETVDSVYFRHDIIKLESILHEIFIKRQLRLQKSIG